MTTAPAYSAVTIAQIKSLEEANPLRESVLRAIMTDLKFAPGSHGLDIGCGIGLQAALLAQAVAPKGHVTGVDISPELLAYAEARIAARPEAERVTFKEGDMRQLPFPDNTFDWAWSADCVGYPAGDLLPVLTEIARVVRPGGTIALLAWTSQQVLPGNGWLEAQLNAQASAYAPYLQDQPAAFHFTRALRWFAAAGLTDLTAHTYVGDVQAPLGAAQRVGLASLFAMLWDESRISEIIRPDYWRLCRADSPDCLLDSPDYYAFFTYTVFSGRVAK